mmetsp:Transcript_38779/g.58956  ORF Transcript_38779/g.58956 Transcript_38779/m.58956 type:complete len:108 (-) Transcript_38779:280-603(-)
MYQTSRRLNRTTKLCDRLFNRFTFVDPKYLIQPSDWRKLTWDIIVIAFAIIKAFLVPIEMSFQPDFTSNWFFFTSSILIDLMFAIDMILTCLTLYRDDKGNEVRDSS